MLWVSSKTFGKSFGHGVRSVLAVCTLAGCFLDETPRPSSSSSASKNADASKPEYVPRDPGPGRTQTADGSVVDAEPTSSGNETGTTDPADASTSAPSVMPMQDAQVAPMRDAQVAPAVDASVAPIADAGSTTPAPTTDAALDAGPPPVLDAGPPPPAALPQPIHRYEFEGSARVARDSIGSAHGELQGRAFISGMGEVQLGGMYEDAVVLPPRILQGVRSFTMLGWMVPRSQECTQRLFEFIYFREGQQRTQVSALYLAPYACPDSRPALGYLTERKHTNVVSEQRLDSPREQVLLGAMYDANTEVLQLIVNGVIVQSETVPIQPRELSASQGSLGRSSPEGEAGFGGSIAEFRIYDQTLDEATLAEIARRGPDQL